MARKSPRRKKKSPIPPIGEQRYERIYHILLGGYDLREHNTIYYDLGPGERPQVAKAHFQEVARREGFDVTLLFETSQKKSLVIHFHEAPPEKEVQVYDAEGELLARKEMDTKVEHLSEN